MTETGISKELNMRDVYKSMGRSIRKAFIHSYALFKSGGKYNADFVLNASKVRYNYKNYANAYFKKLNPHHYDSTTKSPI